MHAHDHASHAHSHAPTITNLNKALLVGASLNILYVVVEAGAGFYADSMALLADAGHNLTDVAGLLLSLLAFRLAKVKSSPTFTYGYRKSTILASFINAVLLLVAVGAILVESIQRFRQPEPVPGNTVAWVAAMGIVINAASALLFFRDKDHDLNIRGAYLHLLADALVSVGVVVSGLVMRYTGWFWLDPVVGLVVAVVILTGTWRLLADSLRLTLDGVPTSIDMAEVKKTIRNVPGVAGVHHIHVWAMSTTETALTAHLTLSPSLSAPETNALKSEVRHQLEHLGISHATLETN